MSQKIQKAMPMRSLSKYIYCTVLIVLVIVISFLITGYFLVTNSGCNGYRQVIKHDYDWGSTNAYLWPSQKNGMLYALHLRFDVYDEYEPRINAVTITSIKIIINLKDIVCWDSKGTYLLEAGERYYGYADNIFTFITPYHLRFDRVKLPYEPLRMSVVCTFKTETGTVEQSFKYFFKTKGLDHNDLRLLGLDGCIPK